MLDQLPSLQTDRRSILRTCSSETPLKSAPLPDRLPLSVSGTARIVSVRMVDRKFRTVLSISGRNVLVWGSEPRVPPSVRFDSVQIAPGSGRPPKAGLSSGLTT